MVTNLPERREVGADLLVLAGKGAEGEVVSVLDVGWGWAARGSSGGVVPAGGGDGRVAPWGPDLGLRMGASISR